MWLFLTSFLAWKRGFAIFLHRGTICLWKWQKLNCFDIQCVVEASTFSLNHNMTLESKENYPRHTKTVQNSLGDLVMCALISKNNVNLILFFMENHWWECFLQNKTKRIYIWFDFYSEISKLLSFIILPKFAFLTKNKNKHNSKCVRPILMRFSIFISTLLSPMIETH